MNYSTKFGDAKKEYIQFRPDYPMSLFDTILNNTPKPFLNAIDLGAGTGISTQILSDHFVKVYAVEPDYNMLRDVHFSENIIVSNCAAEDFVCDDTIDLVTAGNAFYWMNGELVVEKIVKWLREKGLFAAFRYNFPNTTFYEVQKVINYELLTHWNEFRSERLIDTEYSFRTINESKLFSKIDLIHLPNIKKLTIDEYVGFFTSTSYCSAYIKTFKNKDHYIRTLTESIRKSTINNSTIDVDFSIELILANK